MSSSGTLCMRTPQVALERRYSMHMHTVGVCVCIVSVLQVYELVMFGPYS